MKSPELTNLETAGLCRELALLLRTGIPASDSLFLMSEQSDDARMGALLEEMARRMDGGCALSETFREAGCFPAYMTGLIAVGETVGREEEALNALCSYYEEREELERQTVSALTYPAILFMLMLVVIVILLSRVLPVFNDIYASLGGRLSGVAGGLLLLGQFLDRAMPVLLVLLGAAALSVGAYTLHRGFRESVTGLWRRRWGDRGVARKLNDARTAQALAMGLRSGMPLEEAMELAASLQDQPDAARRCGECREGLLRGEDLARALESSGLMTKSECRLLAIGMRGGSGDEVMERIAARKMKDAHHALGTAVSRVEPALILITSGLVGVILLCVMLPLMDIMSAIG